MIRVKVPATTANLGPGFDCMGMALGIFNTVEAEEREQDIEVGAVGRDLELIEYGGNNLIIRAIRRVCSEVGYPLKGLRLNCINNIPVARGLGSSAACTAAGLVIGNAISGGMLERDQLLQMGIDMEGHPDNIVPAVLGGMCVSCVDSGERPRYVKVKFPDDLKFAVLIPDFTLSTDSARKLLPRQVDYRDAVFNISRAAMLIASLVSGELQHLRLSTEDRLHQPYRKKLIPDIDRIFDFCYEEGARASFISGSGSSLIAVLDKNDFSFEGRIRDRLRGLSHKWEVCCVNLAGQGAVVIG